MTTMTKAEALSAGITQAHSTPIELAKGILSAHLDSFGRAHDIQVLF